MGLEPQHGGGAGTDVFRDQVLADDDDGQACRTHVLLSASVENAEFFNRQRLGQRHGRDIRNQRNIAGIGDFGELGAVDGIVHADIEIICGGVEFRLIQLGDIGEGLVGGRCDDVDVLFTQQQFCFGSGLFRPLAGQDIVDLAGFGRKVKGNHRKLGRCAAL